MSTIRKQIKSILRRGCAAMLAALLLLLLDARLDKRNSEQANANYSLDVNALHPQLSYAPAYADRLGIPMKGYRHKMGEGFDFSGRIESTVPLYSLKLHIAARFDTGLADSDIDAVIYAGTEQKSIDLSAFNSLADLSSLSPGEYRIYLTATDRQNKQSLGQVKSNFYVLGEQWEHLDEKNFFDSYQETLSFLGGDTEKLLYSYQKLKNNYILPHPDWIDESITVVKAYPKGEAWSFNKAALPSFEMAFEYLESVYIRVICTDSDSGIIPLYSLIKSYGGGFVPHFTSDKEFISFHALGLAVDINHVMECNKYTFDNKELIRREVNEHLRYDGIKENGGQSYYSFFYDGDCMELYMGVPETIINYLLYELAFSRSGFIWGHYYQQKSDGMHFVLGETVQTDHGGADGLRKVFDYDK